MSKPLRLLHVEDSAKDAELLVRQLRQEGYEVLTERVWTVEAMCSALSRGPWDVVISDYKMTQFDGLAALGLVQKVASNIPFILVSDVAGDGAAVSILQAGADDFLRKDDLSRLGPAVERSLRDASERKRHKQAEEARSCLVTMLEATPDFAGYADARTAQILYVNKGGRKMCGLVEDEDVTRLKIFDVHPTWANQMLCDAVFPTAVRDGFWSGECAFLHRDGREIPVLMTLTAHKSPTGQVEFFSTMSRDITEHKQTHESLKLFRALIDQSNDVVMVVDPATGRFLDVNARGCSGLGYSREEFLALKVPDIDPLVDPSVFRANSADLPKTGPSTWNGLHRRKDGSTFPVEVSLKYVRLDRDFVIAVVRDVSERKQAEAALKESERRFRELMENIQLMGVMLDTRGNVIFCNDYLLRLSGWTREEVLGLDWFSRFTPGNEQLKQLFHGNIELGVIPAHVENDIVTRQGERRCISWDNTMLRDQQGTNIGVASIGEDITERKRAEDVLRQSEQRKTILNQIAHIFLTASDQEMYAQVLGVVLQVMKSKFGLFGYIGRHGDLVVPSLTGEVWSECKVSDKSVVFSKETCGESLWGRAITERTTFCSDGPFHTPKGHIRIDHFLAVPIVFGDTAIGLLCVANAEQSYTEADIEVLESIAESISPILNARMQRDLQEEKRQQAEEEIRKLNAELEMRVIQRTAQLEVANRDLESFSYSVSHDLRAPLRAISGFTSILTQDHAKQLDEQGKRHLAVVRSEAERMGRLIDDLLQFSRLGRQAVQLVKINMGELAQKVFDECASQVPDRKIQFKLNPLPSARGDATLLREVWVNLLSNAIKYTRPRPVAKIEVTGKKENTEIVYCVKDNGVGFDMKYADKLFGVFQRLHSESEFEGTGVGLSLVQRLVARHGGRVWAEAKANEGAAFYFTLPNIAAAGS